MRRERVAILGGGIAGLAAAWELSGEAEVTVYERDWRLGGKGASSRGEHGRIEEHGLHVWLGYYDNAFRLIREVYEALERPPGSPLADWRDAFLPARMVGAQDRFGALESHWVATFAANRLEPGDPDNADPLSPVAFVRRGLGLLADFAASHERSRPLAGVVLSASPLPPRRTAPDDFAGAVRQAEIAALIGAVESLRVLRAGVPAQSALGGRLAAFLERAHEDLLDRLRRDDDSRRLWHLADLLIGCMRGIVTGGLLDPAITYRQIDHLDFREWLAGQGVHPETLESTLARVVYDLVFAYEGGDPERPRFSAALGLVLAYKLFFEYKGSIFWKMRAGMGDVVFAPLYEALRARGVRFRLGHRVTGLHLDAGRRRVEAVSLLGAGDGRDPLVRVRGLPVFPLRPEPRPRRPLRLVAGRDFDTLVLAAAYGALGEICGELVADSPRWEALTTRLGTVSTQALQVWARADEQELGWHHGGATVAGYRPPFEVYAAMSHTLPFEDWPDDGPRTVGYFCGTVPTRGAKQRLTRDVEAFLDGPIARFWPGFTRAALVSRYARVNTDPSGLYVQSLPGTLRWRLAPHESGYENLVLAGDWTDNGHNAGCIEAAVLSGLQAANAVRGAPPMDGVLGQWSRR
jgi:uncharacterized protein with NAD-binding domain and iron-sulfur cluster